MEIEINKSIDSIKMQKQQNPFQNNNKIQQINIQINNNNKPSNNINKPSNNINNNANNSLSYISTI